MYTVFIKIRKGIEYTLHNEYNDECSNIEAENVGMVELFHKAKGTVLQYPNIKLHKTIAKNYEILQFQCKLTKYSHTISNIQH